MRNLFLAALVAAPLAAQTPAPRPIRINDYYHIRSLRDPQIAPDGGWVAYVVSSVDSAADKTNADLWMTSWDGAQTIQLTSTKENETNPRFSPDGRWLAFLSSRDEGKGAQVWLLDRRGGEAQRIIKIEGGVSEIVWSPDSKRLALIASLDTAAKKDTSAKAEDKPKPIVIDRYEFKRDVDGYLESENDHILVLDIATKKLDTLTTGRDDDESPRWSPDGARLAFVRSPRAEPGAGGRADVYVMDAKKGAAPKRLSTFAGVNAGPAEWSPDGKWIVYRQGAEPKYWAYSVEQIVIAPSDGGAAPRLVAPKLDRPQSEPRFEADGKTVLAIIDDDRTRYLARIRVADGSVVSLTPGWNSIVSFAMTTVSGASRIALTLSTPERPTEVFALLKPAGAGASPLFALSHQNDSLFSTLKLATLDDFASKSSDGTEVHSILMRPSGADKKSKLPMILFIHGGPNGQDDHGWSLQRQLFAAGGYAVLSPNYRGSSGRGSAYTRAIWADWGHKEEMDLLGAVDEAVKSGIADPDHLGVGGWSYGGISTDYLIASTTRFKGAVAGAASALQLSMYGVDEYITQYELELGAPWKSESLWVALSYPFFHADRIKTPTLFMSGTADFNVPAVGNEQMYQALRANGVPTMLVLYPGQFHGLTKPSFLVDRMTRWIGWYDKWVKPGGGGAPVSK